MLKAAGKTIFILGWATMHAQKCSNMHHEVSLMNSCAFNPKQAMRHQLVLGLSSQNATLTASSLLLRMAPLLPVVRVYACVPVCVPIRSVLVRRRLKGIVCLFCGV